MENKSGNKLVDRILSDARIAASDIEAKANADAIEICAEAAKKREALRKENITKRDASIKSLIDGAVTRARIDGKKYELSLKRGLIDEVFEKSYIALNSMNAVDSAAVLKSILLNEVAEGDTVIPSQKDRELIIKLASELPVKVIVSELNAPVERGFVIQCDGYEKDCSFRSLLNEVRENEETAVSKLLFG